MADKIFDASDAGATRDKSTGEPPRFITVGGLVDRTSVSLCIYGDDLVPEDISRSLGVAPTSAHCKGELIKSASPQAPHDATYRTGAWILKVRGWEPGEPEELTTALLDQLPEDEAMWADLAERHRVELSFGLHMEAWNRGFALSPRLVARLARMRVAMNFDIYAYLEDKEE